MIEVPCMGTSQSISVRISDASVGKAVYLHDVGAPGLATSMHDNGSHKPDWEHR